MESRMPIQPIPDPIRASEPGTWAQSTVEIRLAEIARRVMAENRLNRDQVARLERLIGELPHGSIRRLEEPAAPDRDAWGAFVAPHLGQTWLDVPWFFAETYFYRRVLEAIGYYLDGPGHGQDPFLYQKQQGLGMSLPAARSLSDHVHRLLANDNSPVEALGALINAALWGNRADLSLWPAKENGGTETLGQPETFLLVNDNPYVARYLYDSRGQTLRVDVICDNAGYELVADLLLVYYLLASGQVQEIHIHLKAHPTFVSDATPLDVRETIGSLAGDSHPTLTQHGQGLRAAVNRGVLKPNADPFWTSPLSGWEMPAGLRDSLATSDLVIVKGDANYRRILGDRHWPFTTPFADIIRYFPAPLLALRTLKAELAAGLSQTQIDRLNRTDPTWMTNGRWGIIQFARP